MDTVVCGMTQLSVEVVSQQGRCLKPTRRATRAHAGTVTLAELLTASRCARSSRCTPLSRIKTPTPGFTIRFLFYDRLLSDESTRRGLLRLGVTPSSWAEYNACHGKLCHVDKDWRTVYNGLMVGCWRRLACVRPSFFFVFVFLPMPKPNRWLHPLRLPMISTTRRITTFFQDADDGTRMKPAWTESCWSAAETEVGRSRVFQRGIPPGMHCGRYRRRSLATGGASC